MMIAPQVCNYRPCHIPVGSSFSFHVVGSRALLQHFAPNDIRRHQTIPCSSSSELGCCPVSCRPSEECIGITFGPFPISNNEFSWSYARWQCSEAGNCKCGCLHCFLTPAALRTCLTDQPTGLKLYAVYMSQPRSILVV
jgi:hypothetical protein